jgi:hypothetical protein
MIGSMVKVYISLQMEKDTMETFEKVQNMEKECIYM